MGHRITENDVVVTCSTSIKMLFGNPEDERPLLGPDVGRRMLLKWMLAEVIREDADSVQLTKCMI